MLFLLSYYERLSAGALLCLELVLLLLGLAAAVGASRRAGQSSSGGGASTGGGASSAGGASSGGGVSQSNARGGARHHGGAGGAGSPLGSPRALRAATGQLLILVCSLLVASSKAWASGLGFRVGLDHPKPGPVRKPKPGRYQVCWLLGLSPILATLTRTFSDDTICALVRSVRIRLTLRCSCLGLGLGLGLR